MDYCCLPKLCVLLIDLQQEFFFGSFFHYLSRLHSKVFIFHLVVLTPKQWLLHPLYSACTISVYRSHTEFWNTFIGFYKQLKKDGKRQEHIRITKQKNKYEIYMYVHVGFILSCRIASLFVSFSLDYSHTCMASWPVDAKCAALVSISVFRRTHMHSLSWTLGHIHVIFFCAVHFEGNFIPSA